MEANGIFMVAHEPHHRLHFDSISTSSECGRQPSLDRQATVVVAP